MRGVHWFCVDRVYLVERVLFEIFVDLATRRPCKEAKKKQVTETVAESRINFYWFHCLLQRLSVIILWGCSAVSERSLKNKLKLQTWTEHEPMITRLRCSCAFSTIWATKPSVSWTLTIANSNGGNFAYEEAGMLIGNFEPLKETNPGVAQAFLKCQNAFSLFSPMFFKQTVHIVKSAGSFNFTTFWFTDRK